jgi:hypothetical protein
MKKGAEDKEIHHSGTFATITAANATSCTTCCEHDGDGKDV